MIIKLPFPYTANALFPTRLIKGRMIRVPSANYVKWRKEADLMMMVGRHKQLRCQVRLEITLIPPDRRARDADNYNKALIDALVRNGILPDDSNEWVRSIETTWCDPDKLNAGATIRIIQLPKQVDLEEAISKAAR